MDKKSPKKSTFFLEMAINKALKTPEDERQNKIERDWYKRTESDDPKVAAAAFKEEWKEIEPLIKNDEDKIKLKKKFGIK